ncbi:MAG TPA: hypothetical protein VKY59_20725 [Spirillospora sp.]|nr:hypothetical protein [Spirillospora sp.]
MQGRNQQSDSASMALILIGMGLLSGAALLLQVTLTRFFSVAQFYHFAFLVVSLALLGFGASGSLLVIWPRLRGAAFHPWYALGFALTIVLAYLFANHLPFDSYSIAWDSHQVLLLAGNLLGLAVPFAFAGALIGSLLSAESAHADLIYGVNLLGSAGGAVLAPLIIGWLGSERAALLCALLGLIAGLILSSGRRRTAMLTFGLLVIALAFQVTFPPIFEINPSPYKRLSQFRLNPDARIVATHQNAYARLDIVESQTIHSAPGLSLTYLDQLPPQAGLIVDGDQLLAVPQTRRASAGLANALPVTIAHALRPEGQVLLLGSGGGMDAWAALMNGAAQVTIVEPNQLVYDALTNRLRDWFGIVDDPRVTLVDSEIRAFVQNSSTTYDVVELTLADNYRPISAGAFTLTENYALTVEAFEAYLRLCGDDGLFTVTRWLQSPPSEDLRTLGLIVEALNRPAPLQHILAFRSFQTITFTVRPTPFTDHEIATFLERVDQLRYDLVLAPEMPPEMINRYARLETPVYHDTFLQFVSTPDRASFYDSYPFEIAPPDDDKPFFFHFFKWEQTPDVLENLGRRWQPFGGSGYFVMIVLLGFTVLAGLVFVILPLGISRRFRQALRLTGTYRSLRALAYFVSIGLAYLFVEVALIQRYLLVLDRPTLALATVIGALLLFSGIGSYLSARFPWRISLIALAVLIVSYPGLTNALKPLLLTLPLILRVAVIGLLIAPVGFLMGIPFARGISALGQSSDLIPWAWAANGSASVLSAVLAATLALSLGFTPVLALGAGLYLLAAVVTPRGSAAQT